MIEKSQEHKKLIQQFGTQYFVPKISSKSSNSYLYDILASGSQLFCLLQRHEIAQNKKEKSDMLTTDELLWILDFNIFLTKGKFLPFNKTPNKMFVQTMFYTLFPDLYKELVIVNNVNPVTLNKFDNIIPALRDPRSWDQHHFQQIDKSFIDKLNSTNFQYKDKDSTQKNIFNLLLQQINSCTKKILNLEEDIQNTEISIKKKLEKVKLEYQFLNYEYDQNENFKKFSEQYKEILQTDSAAFILSQPKDNLFSYFKNCSFNTDCVDLYNQYCNKVVFENVGFSIDNWNALHDLWRNLPDDQKTMENQIYIITNQLQIYQSDKQEEEIQKILWQVSIELEIYQFAVNHVYELQKEIAKKVIQSCLSVFLDKILLQVEFGEIDNCVTTNLSSDEILKLFDLYVIDKNETNNTAISHMSAWNLNIFFWTRDYTYQLIKKNKTVKVVDDVSQIICFRSNKGSIENAIILYINSLKIQEVASNQVSNCNIITLFNICISHISGANINANLPAIKQLLTLDANVYSKISTYIQNFDLKSLFLVPCKQSINYFTKQGTLKQYIELLIEINQILFKQFRIRELQYALIILVSAFSNAHRWEAFKTFQQIQSFIKFFEENKQKRMFLVKTFIWTIVNQGWQEYYQKKYQFSSDRQNKHIFDYQDILSLTKTEKKLQWFHLKDLSLQMIQEYIQMGETSYEQVHDVSLQFYNNLNQQQQIEYRDILEVVLKDQLSQWLPSITNQTPQQQNNIPVQPHQYKSNEQQIETLGYRLWEIASRVKLMFQNVNQGETKQEIVQQIADYDRLFKKWNALVEISGMEQEFDDELLDLKKKL